MCSSAQTPRIAATLRMMQPTLPPPRCPPLARPAQSANAAWNWRHPCGREIMRGFSQCSAADFKAFFEGETGDLCT